MVMAEIHATNTAEVLLLHAATAERSPIAHLKIPMRQRCGEHGN